MKRNQDAYERIMLVINNRTNYATKISKELNMTREHVWHCISHLTKAGVIIKSRTSRKMIVTLTEKGEKVKQAYIDLNYAYSQSD